MNDALEKPAALVAAHTYGLAVDVTGIRGPGTPEALLWHEIAARHGVICPHGPHNLVEWNHCQPTRVRIIVAENPLRETVTADGPLSLEGMFEVGYSLIAGSGDMDGPNADPPAHFSKLPHARPAIPRINVTATIKTAPGRRASQTDRSVFNGGPIQRPRAFRGQAPLVARCSPHRRPRRPTTRANITSQEPYITAEDNHDAADHGGLQRWAKITRAAHLGMPFRVQAEEETSLQRIRQRAEVPALGPEKHLASGHDARGHPAALTGPREGLGDL